MNLWWDYYGAVAVLDARLLGQSSSLVAEPAKGDRRFRHED